MGKRSSIAMLGAAVLVICGSHPAQAQQNAANGAIKLPDDVRRVISVDAHNILLAETADPDDPAESEYSALTVLHIYSGGVARVLGGTVIPTELFVSPAFSKGGFGTANPSGITAVGGFNGGGLSGGFNGGLNNGGLGQILNSLDRTIQQATVGQ